MIENMLCEQVWDFTKLWKCCGGTGVDKMLRVNRFERTPDLSMVKFKWKLLSQKTVAGFAHESARLNKYERQRAQI